MYISSQCFHKIRKRKKCDFVLTLVKPIEEADWLYVLEINKRLPGRLERGMLFNACLDWNGRKSCTTRPMDRCYLPETLLLMHHHHSLLHHVSQIRCPVPWHYTIIDWKRRFITCMHACSMETFAVFFVCLFLLVLHILRRLLLFSDVYISSLASSASCTATAYILSIRNMHMNE